MLEAAVDSAESATAAVRAGADRLELCGDLGVGGITPPDALLDGAGSRFGVPVAVMIRPRGGDFTYTADERRQLARDAARAAVAGAAALVTGGLTAAGLLDANVFESVRDAAPNVPIVCHRAIDRTADPLAAIETLRGLGIARVLTSGGARTAWEGRDTLKAMVAAAGDGLTILAGGTVRADIAAALVAHTGVRELHADGRDASVLSGLVAVRYFSA
ncbi:MAG: copper homeostasis protein CutC [Gemmatimonadaceae bacterium]|nr:copper homeostasis protein CutC [Gemmatimonadaceae bacterium]